MVLASICLAFAIVLGMLITAVAAYFLWHGAMFWAEQQGAPGVSDEVKQQDAGHQSSQIHHVQQSQQQMPPQAPQSLVHPNGSAVCCQPMMVHEPTLQWPTASGLAMQPPVHDMSSGSGAQASVGEGLTYRRLAAPRSQSTEHFDDTASLSPLRGAELKFPSPRGQGVAHCSFQQQASPKAAVAANPSDLRRGYAAHLALKFGGDLVFHVDNIEIVTDVYNLDVEDLCYCFLCLEEVGNSSGGDGLRLKKWGTGSFAARLWTTALARFIKSAQKQRGALGDGRVEKVCQQWQYQSTHFLRELHFTEGLFQQKFGRVLLEAFKDNEIRQSELFRARHTLAEHGLKAAPRNARLALPATASDPERKLSLPALPSLQARPHRASSSRMLLDHPSEEEVPAVKRRNSGVAEKEPAKRRTSAGGDEDAAGAAKRRRQSRN